jgi:HK97 family phage major capsid protein
LHDRVEDDPKRGFADLGDFALAVRSHYSPGGRSDERLRFGAAPSNYHQESGTDEGRMVPPMFKEQIFEAVSQADNSLLAAVDSEPTNSNVVEFMRDESTPWGSTGVLAAWRAEGTALSATKLVTGSEQLRLHELYAFVIATGELIQDAPRLADRLTRKSALAINYKINDAIVNGTGAGMPLGWLTSGAKVTVTRNTGSTVKAEDVSSMIARVINPGQAVWYINQDVLPKLLQMTLGNNSVYVPPSVGYTAAPGGFLFGRPVVILENCQTLGTSGDIQLVNPKGYYAAVKGQSPDYAESMHLYFDYNMTAYRWIFRMGGQPYLSAAISPAKGSSTRAYTVILS